MLDSDDFYSYHGGLIACVRDCSGQRPVSVAGLTADPARPETARVETELARVMRSRILNPKWLEGLKRHGYKGAQELSTTFDTFFGWDAAAEVASNWMYDAMARQFLLDEETRRWMEQVNDAAVLQMRANASWRPTSGVCGRRVRRSCGHPAHLHGHGGRDGGRLSMKGGLDTLVLRLTNRCNLACGYCYAGSGPAGEDLSPSGREAVALACPPGGALRIQFTGGEPLLRWDTAVKVLDFGRASGRRFTPPSRPTARCSHRRSAGS